MDASVRGCWAHLSRSGWSRCSSFTSCHSSCSYGALEAYPKSPATPQVHNTFTTPRPEPSCEPFEPHRDQARRDGITRSRQGIYGCPARSRYKVDNALPEPTSRWAMSRWAHLYPGHDTGSAEYRAAR